MTTSVLSIAISGITPADQGAMAEAARRWDSIAKPIGGLGLLEEAVIRAAGVQGTADVSLDRKALAVFCADNGVTEEGVTQTGPEVTASVAASMAWAMCAGQRTLRPKFILTVSCEKSNCPV